MCWARTPRRVDRGSAAIVVVATIGALATLCLLASACGSSGPAQIPRATAPAAVIADTATPGGVAGDAASPATTGPDTTGTSIQPGGGHSLHERVMAEQGRGPGWAPPDRNATTTSSLTSGASAPDVAATPPAGSTTEVLTNGRTPLEGVWGGTADKLASYLLGVAPSPRFTVPTLTLAEYYVRYAAEAGLRADLLWAQMIVETGYGTFSGDVAPEQNNFAGIGATGGGAAGVSFATAEAGVMAQVAHMVAYVYTDSPVDWANSTTDPRFDFVDPRGAATVLSDLDGRWAVPGTGYGASIEAIARSINGG